MTNQNNNYIALLRGINVGGNNKVPMALLKKCFEEMGFSDVVTYINSGNVVFRSPQTDIESLTNTIEKALIKTFSLKIPVVAVSYKELKETVANAPTGFGTKPELYRYDVIFLKSTLTPKDAIKDIGIKEGVDEVFAGKYVLYFSRLIEKATQSKMSRIVLLPLYKSITIRNWNTTTKLLALMEK